MTTRRYGGGVILDRRKEFGVGKTRHARRARERGRLRRWGGTVVSHDGDCDEKEGGRDGLYRIALDRNVKVLNQFVARQRDSMKPNADGLFCIAMADRDGEDAERGKESDRSR